MSSERLHWLHEHIPVSFSVCSNVEGFEAVRHFCVENDDVSAVETLVGNFIDYLERTSNTAFAIYMADPDI